MNVKEAVANWWLTNARIKHGHPSTVAATLDKEAEVADSSGEWNWKKTAITALATALLGAGGGLAASWWMGEDETPPPAPTQQQSGSLYQYLEDNGYHVE